MKIRFVHGGRERGIQDEALLAACWITSAFALHGWSSYIVHEKEIHRIRRMATIFHEPAEPEIYR